MEENVWWRWQMLNVTNDYFICWPHAQNCIISVNHESRKNRKTILNKRWQAREDLRKKNIHLFSSKYNKKKDINKGNVKLTIYFFKWRFLYVTLEISKKYTVLQSGICIIFMCKGGKEQNRHYVQGYGF